MYTDLDTLRTILRAAHNPRDFSWRRTAFTDGILGLVLLAGGVDRLAERIDARRYPEHVRQDLGAPIYIVAAPRSGTTFLHRLMAQDTQFTTFKLYQTFFPTVTTNKVADFFGQLSGPLGRALDRIRARIDESSFGGWAGLHDMGLGQDEEDEALWTLALATPAILLALPYFQTFDYLRFVDLLPEDKRAKLIAHYRGCLQRHVFFSGGKTLLAKNVLIPGRLKLVRDAVPHARFVHIVRHPYEAIASMLSLFTIPWRFHSPKVRIDGPEVEKLAQLGIDYYLTLHRESLVSERRGEKRFLNLTYTKLLADPEECVRRIYQYFDLDMSPTFASYLAVESKVQRRYKSEHRYSLEQFGLTRDFVFEGLREVFEHYGFEREPRENALKTLPSGDLCRSPCP